MMYYIQLNYQIAPGKAAGAMEFLKKMCEFQKRVTGKDAARILTRVCGVQGHVMILVTYDSLEAWEEARVRNGKDADWKALMAESTQQSLFLGSTDVQLWSKSY